MNIRLELFDTTIVPDMPVRHLSTNINADGLVCLFNLTRQNGVLSVLTSCGRPNSSNLRKRFHGDHDECERVTPFIAKCPDLLRVSDARSDHEVGSAVFSDMNMLFRYDALCENSTPESCS